MLALVVGERRKEGRKMREGWEAGWGFLIGEGGIERD